MNNRTRFITIGLSFFALVVNFFYFFGKINSNNLEFITLFMINVFGFLSSLIQFYSFLNENKNKTSEKINRIYRIMFPLSAKELKEKYKNLR